MASFQHRLLFLSLGDVFDTALESLDLRRLLGDFAPDEIDEPQMEHRMLVRMLRRPRCTPAFERVAFEGNYGIVVHFDVVLQVEADEQRVF